jgi:hypothetical protein
MKLGEEASTFLKSPDKNTTCVTSAHVLRMNTNHSPPHKNVGNGHPLPIDNKKEAFLCECKSLTVGVLLFSIFGSPFISK